MIVVTGGNGQLAKCLELANTKAHRDLLFASREELDITSERSVREFFEKYKPEGVINCAAYTAVDKAEEEEEVAYSVNAKGPTLLAEVCRLQRIPLIHFSTDYVFDGAKNSPYLETDSCNPLNAYGRTKLAGEVALLNADLHGAIIRTSWLYSEFAPNFLMTMRNLAKTRPEIQVVGDQYGSPTYAGALASFTLRHLPKLMSEKLALYHYSNSGKLSWYEFACAILADTHVKIHPIKTSDWKCAAQRSLYSVLDCHKIETLTDEPMMGWREGLELCLNKLS